MYKPLCIMLIVIFGLNAFSYAAEGGKSTYAGLTEYAGVVREDDVQDKAPVATRPIELPVEKKKRLKDNLRNGWHKVVVEAPAAGNEAVKPGAATPGWFGWLSWSASHK